MDGCGFSHLQVSPEVLDVLSIVSDCAEAQIWIQNIRVRVEEAGEQLQVTEMCPHGLMAWGFHLLHNPTFILSLQKKKGSPQKAAYQSYQ